MLPVSDFRAQGQGPQRIVKGERVLSRVYLVRHGVGHTVAAPPHSALALTQARASVRAFLGQTLATRSAHMPVAS